MLIASHCIKKAPRSGVTEVTLVGVVQEELGPGKVGGLSRHWSKFKRFEPLSRHPRFARVDLRCDESESSSYQYVETTHGTQAEHHAAPKGSIIEDPAPTDKWTPLQCNNRQLQHHGDKPIASELFRNAAHDQLVTERADQEGNCHGNRAGEIRLGGEEDMPSEEMIHRNVPFPREFQPVTAVPPVRVEVAIGETGDFRECAQDVFPYDEKDQ